MDFPPGYLDHFQNPRNVGVTPDFTHIAKNRVPPNHGCFDELELTVRVNNDLIEQASFRGRLCSGSIAAASVVTEAITGKKLSDLSGINEALFRNAWGEIPEQKTHAVELLLATVKLLQKK